MRGSPAATCGHDGARPQRQAWSREGGVHRQGGTPAPPAPPAGSLWPQSVPTREETAMTVQTLHIPLPEAIVQRLQHVAEATHRPLEEVVVQTICGNLPPALDDLSPALHEVVADLPT